MDLRRRVLNMLGGLGMKYIGQFGVSEGMDDDRYYKVSGSSKYLIIFEVTNNVNSGGHVYPEIYALNTGSDFTSASGFTEYWKYTSSNKTFRAYNGRSGVNCTVYVFEGEYENKLTQQ